MTQPIKISRLLTHKDDVGASEVVSGALAPVAGEIVLRLDRFALTTNNITYAAFGDAMNYWDFFPTGVEGRGHMPVWGFADVVSSGVDKIDGIDGLAEGERFYGYFPMASHIVMRPERVTPRGFYDRAEHRRPLVSAYNQYTRCSTDPAYAPELEDLQALYRPLFLTSFMLADFLEENAFFGAKRIVFSSASSKTAYGTAFCLRAGSVEIVGLTSPRNAGFVAGLGLYRGTVEYEALGALDAAVPTLYVDFSGDAALRDHVHRHFGGSLVYDCYAGSAASTDFLKQADLPGPEPKFYFAPVQIRKRNTDWGAAEVTRRYNEAQTHFFEAARGGWIDIVEATGLDEAAKVIAELAASGGDPAQGHVVRL